MSYFTPYYPGYYFDARTQSYVPIGRYVSPYQAQVQPLINNYGGMNVGAMNIGSHQPGYGNHNFSIQHIGNHHHAPFVPWPNSQVNFSGYNAQFAPVREAYAQPQGPDFSAPASSCVSGAQSASNPGSSSSTPIDLTEDDVVNESVLASQMISSEEVEAAPAPPKPDSSAWKQGKGYLTKKLNNDSWSNAWFLFGSMKNLPATKRNSYCAAHWPTEDAAYEDIVEMSRYFMDAAEMVSYRVKWDHIEMDLALGLSSEQEREEAREELASEKGRLQSELAAKRMTKIDRIESTRYGGWIDRMRGPEFERRFDMKPNLENKQKVKAKRDLDLETERAPKKRRTEAMSKAERIESPKSKSKSKAGNKVKAAPAVLAPEPIQAMGVEQDAEGETDDEEPAAVDVSAFLAPTPEVLKHLCRSPSPAPFSQPGSADLEIIDPEKSLREKLTAQSAEHIPEQFRVPISLAKSVAREENAVVEQQESYESVSPVSEKPLKHITAHVGWDSPSTLPEELPFVEETFYEEQVTAPTVSANAAQAENTVAEADKIMEEETTLSTSVVTAEDLPPAISNDALASLFDDDEEGAAITDNVEVAENIPPSLSEEVAARAVRKEELTQKLAHLTNEIAKREARIVGLGQVLSLMDKLGDKTSEKRIRREETAQEVRCEVEEMKKEVGVLEQELKDIENWVRPGCA